MEITSAQYIRNMHDEESISIKATINGQELFVPLDPSNRHYSEIMRQVELGTLVIQEAD